MTQSRLGKVHLMSSEHKLASYHDIVLYYYYRVIINFVNCLRACVLINSNGLDKILVVSFSHHAHDALLFLLQYSNHFPRAIAMMHVYNS